MVSMVRIFKIKNGDINYNINNSLNKKHIKATD